jgi:hypothetical protein
MLPGRVDLKYYTRLTLLPGRADPITWRADPSELAQLYLSERAEPTVLYHAGRTLLPGRDDPTTRYDLHKTIGRAHLTI